MPSHAFCFRNGFVGLLVPFQLRDLVFVVRSGVPRRGRVRHPEQAKRVEGSARGLARHDESIVQIQTQLFETTLVSQTGIAQYFFDSRL
jgi:hypothetical protein